MTPDVEIARAAAVIRAGGLVAMPTETVYGLAADATSDAAVARIFEAKGRPSFNPLIIHVEGVAMAERYALIPPLARRLIDRFWPGALTLVLPRKEASGISLLAGAGLPTIALRAPAHRVAQALLKAADRPLAAPSANRSGSISPTTAAHVRQSLGARVDLVLDAGPCRVGVESTIVKVDGERAILLRPGGVAREDIERVIGAALERPAGSIEAPGMLESHYAPTARLRLNVAAPSTDEAYLAFGPAPQSGRVFQLSAAQDLVEAAANLFAQLHAADRAVSEGGLSGIAAAPIPSDGLGEAINDRLRRAAARR